MLRDAFICALVLMRTSCVEFGLLDRGKVDREKFEDWIVMKLGGLDLAAALPTNTFSMRARSPARLLKPTGA